MNAKQYLIEIEKENEHLRALTQRRELILKSICSFDTPFDELTRLKSEQKELMSRMQESLLKGSELIQKYFYAAALASKTIS